MSIPRDMWIEFTEGTAFLDDSGAQTENPQIALEDTEEGIDLHIRAGADGPILSVPLADFTPAFNFLQRRAP